MTFSCQEGPKDMITNSDISAEKQNEPMREKTNKLGFRPGLIQTELYKYRRWLEACNFGFKKKRDCTIHVAKTKALISCAVTAQLICVFVFAYADCWFYHAQAQMVLHLNWLVELTLATIFSINDL